MISFKNHTDEIPDLKEDILFDLFRSYRERMIFHQRNPVIEYIMLIHNFGAEAGASIDHPHSQLFASSIIPTYITREIYGSKQFYKDNKECVYCRFIKEEKDLGARIISENSGFIAFTFFIYGINTSRQFYLYVLPRTKKIKEESRI